MVDIKFSMLRWDFGITNQMLLMVTTEDPNLKVMVILSNCIDNFLCPRIEDSWAKVPVLQIKNN